MFYNRTLTTHELEVLKDALEDYAIRHAPSQELQDFNPDLARMWKARCEIALGLAEDCEKN